MFNTSQNKVNAHHYVEKSQEFQSVHFKELISTVNIERGWKILDVGCGTGNNSAILADMVGPTGMVVAIDPIDERIDCAKKIYQRDNLEYHVDSAVNVCKYGNNFDLIVACHVMHWIPSQEKEETFKTLFKALTDGGTFIFVDQNEDKLEDLNKTFRLLGDIGKQILEAHFFETEQTYLQHATQVGFKNATIEKRIIETQYESIEKIFEVYAASFHTIDYHDTLTAFKTLSQYEDFNYMYNDAGTPVMRFYLSFFKGIKQIFTITDV